MKNQQLETRINPYESFKTYSEIDEYEIDKDGFFEKMLDPHNRYAPLIKAGAYITSLVGLMIPSIVTGIFLTREYINNKEYSLIRNIVEHLLK